MTTKQPNQSSGPRKWSQLSWQILPAVSFALLLFASWRRWMPLISDTGRELDLPQRLLEGQVLYRDIHYMYPPLSPYFFAFLYRVFGSRVEVLNAAGIVGSILVVILCSGLAKRLLTLPARSIAVSSVIVWCIFKPEGNLVSPYSFSALIGMVLALSTLAVSLRYVDHPSIRSAFIAGILIGLAGITKQEFALTAALTWTASVIFVRRRNISKVVAETAVAAAISILIAIPVYYHFISTLGLDLLIRDCHLLYTSIPASLVFYNQSRTGLDHPVSSLWQLFGGIAVCSSIAALISLLVTSASRDWKKKSLVWLAVSLTLAFVVGLSSIGRWDGSPLRAMPAVLLFLAVLAWRGRLPGRENGAVWAISVYSLAVLIRVLLRVPSGGSFGGFFMPTSLILIIYMLSAWYPRFLERRVPGAERKATQAFLTLVCLWMAVTAGLFAFKYRASYTEGITTSRGSLFVLKAQGEPVREALRFLAENTRPGDRVPVAPEGSALTFLAERRMPLRHQMLFPDFMDAREEQRAIDEMRRSAIILVVNRPTREFGAEAYGRDFYRRSGEVLRNECRLEKIWGGDGSADQEIGSRSFFIKAYRPLNKVQ